MNSATSSEEIAALKARLAETEAALAESQEARRRLEGILSDLQREKFGSRSEKLSPDQYNLPLEDVELAQGVFDAAHEKAEATLGGKRTGAARPRNRNRGHLPAHLPRVERVIEPDSTMCPCGCGAMAKIGENVSELDVVPAQFRVLVTRRPRYACRRCSGAVVQAHAPEHVVPGGLPTEALIAQVIVSKFGDHVPFYRQADIYTRQGVKLDRATLGNWAGRACFHLQPIAEHMRKHLAAADRIFMDETTAPVLDPGRRQTKKGFFWAIASDDRGTAAPARRSCCSATRLVARAPMPRRSFRAIAGTSCNAMDMRPMSGSPASSGPRGHGRWCIAGAICAAASSSWRNQKSPIAEAAVGQIATLYAVEATYAARRPRFGWPRRANIPHRSSQR